MMLQLRVDQVQAVINDLQNAYNEQVRIMNDASNIVCNQLSSCWECDTQRAYQESFIGIRDNVLKQITNLIEILQLAVQDAQNQICVVDISLASSNASLNG